MLISTRGRYAIRFLIDLAENQNGGYITTRELAERQEVSKKYAERLTALLAKKNLLKTRHGKGGGYKLAKEPENYKILEILTAMDEDLAPVECLSCEPNKCPRAENCKTLPMWTKLDEIINNFFKKISLKDLLKK